MLLLAIVVTTVVAAQQPTAESPQERIKDPAEYDALAKALKQTSLKPKIYWLRQFIQQYPNSVVKEQALEELFIAYGYSAKQLHPGDFQPASDLTLQMTLTANSLLYLNPDNLRALGYLVSFEETVAKTTRNPQQAALNHADAVDMAKRGLRVVANTKKPAYMSNEAYAKYISSSTAIFHGALNDSSAQRKHIPQK
jgi:hypothetical protein